MVTGYSEEAAPKTALLIVPVDFYSFGKVVAGELSRQGYEVTIANDEYPANTLGKILGKLRIQWLLSRITRTVVVRDFLQGKEYDVALIVKGRGVSETLIVALRQHAKAVIGYNFDSFAYNPSPIAWYKAATRYCTFDYRDSRQYALPRVDLFSALEVDGGPKPDRFDLSAILRNHSRRLTYLDSVLRAGASSRTFVYIYELNVFTFLQNFVRSPRLYLRYWKDIHFRPLPYGEYVSVLHGSNFTLDYAHPSQSGITIRCFEASSARTKIVTNNPYVLDNAHFDRGSTIVFEERGDPEVLKKQMDAIKGKVSRIRHRSIADFVADVLDLGEAAAECRRGQGGPTFAGEKISIRDRPASATAISTEK